jgi:hypothetical protein
MHIGNFHQQLNPRLFQVSIVGLAGRQAGIAKAEDAEVCQKLARRRSFGNGSGGPGSWIGTCFWYCSVDNKAILDEWGLRQAVGRNRRRFGICYPTTDNCSGHEPKVLHEYEQSTAPFSSKASPEAASCKLLSLRLIL